jgi:uridylate kinase
MDKTYIISLGGSLIVPDKIDVEFLKHFKKLLLTHLKNKNFYLICGGGRTARNYIEAIQKISKLKKEELDWIGIKATRINAQLLKALFLGKVHPVIYHDPNKVKKVKEKICLAAGWKPGWSTDYDAVLIAKKLKIKTVINLTNIDYVYDKDPRKFHDAKSFDNMSWKDFKKLVGNKWTPGANLPFDPIACQLAEKEGIEVVILNGQKLDNLKSYLNNKKFIGTTIR